MKCNNIDDNPKNESEMISAFSQSSNNDEYINFDVKDEDEEYDNKAEFIPLSLEYENINNLNNQLSSSSSSINTDLSEIINDQRFLKDVIYITDKEDQVKYYQLNRWLEKENLKADYSNLFDKIHKHITNNDYWKEYSENFKKKIKLKEFLYVDKLKDINMTEKEIDLYFRLIKIDIKEINKI